ncbi:Short-chain dehydrogenase/reductase SDR [Vibrio nigripulchritudo MADA3029]|uniref:SDR family NAD(P)-dependent oxidoreductase n=1 Tax=Vibrio nigripulchritudo TaxID=28173 RepID=UPI0003B2325F|nr:SDR family NAD(P)-dependent oxidoreductase [Vibrio nigripulchritudo]BDU39147.1 3-oxoacyl-ACP reductase [Vibrio nigripulchritudo]CCN47352.1 Short-chain dehydrogenase/reductase SDR [Vibrio nigripulchritudo MADA3020]CCN55217.1 Short-chain dehydrogenase/reductase SDR [Vibrio nigripulchritudo MADA3021]CCN60996.1 Short-chain dehydrogenase/reductase SDR [Vibrio nigripulchritudo MADA3029]
MNKFDLQDQCAVITGGGRGMGLAVAKKLLSSGAKVALWDINDKDLEQAKEALGNEGDVSTHVVDVSNYEQVSQAAQDVVNQFGKISILVNSAGVAGINTTLTNYPLDVWRQVQSVNLDGVFHTCRAIVPHMESNQYGRIVNIASVAGKEGNPNASAYSVSKAAVLALTKSLGKELATSNITVNAITPAVIKTEMLADVTQEQIDYMLAKIPMGRMGSVEEIAAMVAWLSSEECSYSTGATFDMSGGRTTY